MKGFSNRTVRQPCEGKPHLVLIGGYWRVSPQPRPFTKLQRFWWHRAHTFALMQNEEFRHARR